jgi:hypothetical protein
VATHLSFPSVCHVAVDGDVFRWQDGGDGAMARTYREVAIEEMLGTVEEPIHRVIITGETSRRR